MSRAALTIGSLFSGIGGLEHGLELAGLGPVKWQAESDAFAREVLARHWPTARRYEDVREVGSGVEHVDIVCGGFPCQDVSLAGAGAGLEGERSGLWTEIVRVAGVVGCRYLVLENVSALLVRGVGSILGTLAESGFDAAWDCGPAAAVGAPHRRDRVFLLAWRVPDAERDAVRQLAERGKSPPPPADARHTESRLVGTQPDTTSGESSRRPLRAGARAGCERRERRHEVEAACRAGDILADPDRWRREIERVARRQPGDEGAPRRVVDGCGLPLWPPGSDDVDGWARVPAAAQPAVRRVADGVRGRVDRARRERLKALGNAVLPAVAEVVGRLIVAAEEERLRVLAERTRAAQREGI